MIHQKWSILLTSTHFSHTVVAHKFTSSSQCPSHRTQPQQQHPSLHLDKSLSLEHCSSSWTRTQTSRRIDTHVVYRGMSTTQYNHHLVRRMRSAQLVVTTVELLLVRGKLDGQSFFSVRMFCLFLVECCCRQCRCCHNRRRRRCRRRCCRCCRVFSRRSCWRYIRLLMEESPRNLWHWWRRKIMTYKRRFIRFVYAGLIFSRGIIFETQNSGGRMPKWFLICHASINIDEGWRFSCRYMNFSPAVYVLI